MFHSGASGSSALTKVGSPPTLRWTPAARRSSSMRSPSESTAAHSASPYGFVTRARSTTRVTLISKSNSLSTFSTAPVIGAALLGFGVAASGMWPSAASSPEVGSSPIQPAPGT